MDIAEAVMHGIANMGKPERVFDWNKAARIIRERKPHTAYAGLAEDLEDTFCAIYVDGEPLEDGSGYLASTWATELYLDGDSVKRNADPETEIRENIRRDFERWNEIAVNGCSDPFWADGANMRLVRNHILYWYGQLTEGGFTLKTLFGEYPEERSVPPKVPENYMVKGGHNADRLERTRTKAELSRIVWGYSGEYAV